MTERSFQETRKIMQQANWKRGQITSAEANVAKWTAFEDSLRRNMKQGQADGAKKKIEEAIKKLEKRRAEFASLKLPDSDLPPLPVDRCDDCGAKVTEGEEHICEELK